MMPTLAGSPQSTTVAATMQTKRTRSYWIALALQVAVVALYCVWVLSMPVFPSQDAPLHLYCVDIFRQLLAHKSTTYTHIYYISSYLPPYSLYYYSLVALGKLTTLEMADKIIVCGYFVVIMLGLRSLTRAVSGSADWAPLLFAPVLVSWPLMMGFVNYCIGIGFACFALATWVHNRERPSWRYRAGFLLWLVLILVTHPVPWMFVLGFCFFELAIRLLGPYGKKERKARRMPVQFRADLVTALIGCLGYFYLRMFRSAPLPADPLKPGQLPPSYIHNVIYNAYSYVRTHGLTVYSGTRGAALVSRLGVVLIFIAALVVAAVYAWPFIRARRWNWSTVWTLFALLFLVVLPLIPDVLNGSFYFAWRLQVLLYLSTAVAASAAMATKRRPLVGLAIAATFLCLFNLGLAYRRISPVARTIATLHNAPAIHTDKPGLLTRPLGVSAPAGLLYNPEYWAGALYFREHDLILYNLGWLNLPIIPVKPRPEYFHALDDTYFVETPTPGNRLFKNDAVATRTLSRVGFVLAMRVNTPEQQSPFAETEGSPTPGAWAAGWTCYAQPEWKLCVPPGQTIDTAAR